MHVCVSACVPHLARQCRPVLWDVKLWVNCGQVPLEVLASEALLELQPVGYSGALRLHHKHQHYTFTHVPYVVDLRPLSSTHLPDEVSERVSPVEDLLIDVHPDLCNPDLVALKQLLVWEAIRQVVTVQMSHTGTGYHLHGAPT